MTDCRRCEKYNGCKRRGDNERVPYFEYYRRPHSVPYSGSRHRARRRDARRGLESLSLRGNICEKEDRDCVTEGDVREVRRFADMMLVYLVVNKLTSSQKLLLYAIFTTKDTSPTTIYACYNRPISGGMNGFILTPKWLSILAQELELLGFVDIHREGRVRGRGTDFTIKPSRSIDRKYTVENVNFDDRVNRRKRTLHKKSRRVRSHFEIGSMGVNWLKCY